MSVLDGKCAKPQNPKPMVTTSFCVYDEGHEGNCSWADTGSVRAEKLFAAREAARAVSGAGDET